MVAVTRAIGRVDGSIEPEDVSISSGATTRRPIVSVVTRVPESTSSICRMDVPTAHEMGVYFK